MGNIGLLLQTSASWSQARCGDFEGCRRVGSTKGFRPISDAPWRLTARLAAQFFQFVKAGSALLDVREKARLLDVPGSFRESQQGLTSWTADALRIGEVLMDDPFKRFQQFLFGTHSALPGQRWSPTPLAVVPLGESHDWRPGVDENLCVDSLDTPRCCPRVMR